MKNKTNAAPAPEFCHECGTGLGKHFRPGEIKGSCCMKYEPAPTAPAPAFESWWEQYTVHNLRKVGDKEKFRACWNAATAHPVAAPAPDARELWDMIQAYANEEMNNGVNVRAAVEQIVRMSEVHANNLIAAERDYSEAVERAERAEQTNADWLAANGPGGWIDDLRVERDELRALLVSLRSECRASAVARIDAMLKEGK